MSQAADRDAGLAAPAASAAGRPVPPVPARPPSAPLPPVRIAIAYRDPAVRSALREVLEQVPGCQVVADGTDAAEVAEQVRRHPSDLLLVDVRTPEITGMTDLLDAAGHKPAPAGHPPGRAPAETGPDPVADGRHLTPRERQILGLIAAGLSNRQIAELLVISPKTVKNHVSNIYQHMGVSQRSQAISAWRGLSARGGFPA